MGGDARRLNERGARAGQVLRRHVHFEFLRGSVEQQGLALPFTGLERYARIANFSALEEGVETCERLVHYHRLELRSLE